MTTIVHLVDDALAGGVMRLLSHIENDPEMTGFADHRIVVVKRGTLKGRWPEADVIVSHLSVSWRCLPSLIALRASNAHVPLVHVEHSYTQAFTALNVPSRARFHTLLRTAYSLFDRVVSVSKGQAAWLSRRGLVAPQALVTIPSAVGLAPFLALRPIHSGPRVFGAMGRLDRQKGFDLLIEAFRAVEDPMLRLRIVGDGPDRPALEALAAGDPRIAFTGFAVDPVEAMARLDAVVMPSRWEAYGLVALEARAAGRPLLVNAVDGLADHAAAGAVTVHGGTVWDWSHAIKRLSQAGPALHIEVARARSDAAQASTLFAMAWQALTSELLADQEHVRAA